MEEASWQEGEFDNTNAPSHITHPTQVSSSLCRTQYLTFILHTHSMEMYDGLATDLVLRTGYALVFPVYKLAPEAKWPEQQDQCFAVLEWLTQNGACHNLVTDRFALMGDSAGGKS